MSKRVNPTTIGAFVLGALAIAVIGVLALGGRAWFTRPVTCVMAFDGSVAGLSVGAPVAFRGVPLGTVTHIQLRAVTSLIAVYVDARPLAHRGPASRYDDQTRGHRDDPVEGSRPWTAGAVAGAEPHHGPALRRSRLLPGRPIAPDGRRQGRLRDPDPSHHARSISGDAQESGGRDRAASPEGDRDLGGADA